MNRFEEMLARQREYVRAGNTRPFSFRLRQLTLLEQALQADEAVLLQALKEDLGKAPFEGYETELGILLEELRFAKRNLAAWMRPRRVPTPLMHFPSKSVIVREPLGVVLILSPWNYPLQLTLAPLIAALSAGNCAVVKPSRYAPKTAAALQRMLAACFPPELVSVVQGGREENQELLALRFDHIFFTGSPQVGRVVMEAAAKHLTPVTLELGGKSPCLIDETAQLDLAARRIAWGKGLNAGQTCVAPDYVLLPAGRVKGFAAAYRKAVRRFYGADPLSNPEYPRIITQRHFERLCRLMESGTVLWGGRTDPSRLKIEPTLLFGVAPQSAVMQEEIFGPLLPLVPYETIEEALGLIESLEKPLAFYLFTRDKALAKRVLLQVPFGGGCINDTVIHLSNPRLPFGGVGESGMGAYHGKKGFDTLSHEKSVLLKSDKLDIPFRYPPYGKRLSILRKIMR